MTSEKNPLIDGIMSSSRKEAEKIVSDAEARAASMVESALREAEAKALRIKEEADQRIRDIGEKAVSQKRSAERLDALRKMDHLSQKVLAETEESVRSMAEDGRLKEVLPSWIAEAAIGVGASDMVVSYAPVCPVDEKMLKEAENIYTELTEEKVTLSLGEASVKEPGVVVSDRDGRISFRNTVSARLRRFSRDIREIVQEENAR